MKKPVNIFNYSVVVNAAEKKATIHIDGEIVDASTQAMIKAFFGDSTTTSYKSFRNELESHDNIDVIDVIINSPGGHVGDALAIHDLLADLQAKGKVVNTIGRGIVASAGTLILLAGKAPEMSANTFMMMHDAAGGVYGSVEHIENYAVIIRKFNNKIRDFYAEKSGMRKEDVAKLMKAETWLTAEEAKEKGFIAKISGEVPFTNKLNEEEWPYENTAILNKYNGFVRNSESNILDDMKKTIAQWGKDLMAAIKNIKPKADASHEDVLNSFGEVLNASITKLGDDMEASQNEAIANYLKTDAGKAVVNALVVAAIKDKSVTDAINATVATATENFVKKEDFDTEIEGIKGAGSTGGTSTKNKAKDPEPVGGFLQN